MLNENYIVSRLRQKDEYIFELLFIKYRNSLVRFANYIVYDIAAAEDIVQGVFVYLWENSKHIVINSSISSYLFRSVKNKCLNHLRDLKIRDKHQLVYLEAILELSKEDDSIDDEIVDEIKQIISNLPNRMYEVLHRKYFREMSVKDIAKELAISENTVKVQLFKGRIAIRQFFDLATG